MRNAIVGGARRAAVLAVWSGLLGAGAGACGGKNGAADAGTSSGGANGGAGLGGNGAGARDGGGLGGSGNGSGGSGGAGSDAGQPPVMAKRGRIAAGLDWTCAVAQDGTLVCWGTGISAAPPSGRTFSFVGAGQDSMCAVDSAGAVACWARSMTAIIAIDRTPPSGSIQQVAVGGSSTSEYGCALRATGEPACWRNNDLTAIPALTSPPASLRLREMAAGPRFACGVTLDGAAACWGIAGEAPLTGVPNGSFASVAVGEAYACAAETGGRPRCWGLAPTFETSFGATAQVVQVAASRSHTTILTCGLLKDGRVFCARDGAPFPTPPAPVPSFEEIAVGDKHVCGVTVDRTVICWSDTAGPITQVPAGLHVLPR
jgi:hypothetical protein